MSEDTHSIFDDMGATKVCSNRQSLEEFIPQFRRHEWAILNSQETLRSLKDALDLGKRVWPVECNGSIKSLTILCEHCRKFHASIQRSMHLPLVVVPLRLHLLLTLKNIDLQITKLTQLLVALRDTSRASLSQPSEERQVALYELDVLMQYCQQALLQSEDLLRRAKEREYSTV